MQGQLKKAPPFPKPEEVKLLENKLFHLLNVKANKMFESAMRDMHKSFTEVSPELKGKLIGSAEVILLNKMIVYLNRI